MYSSVGFHIQALRLCFLLAVILCPFSLSAQTFQTRANNPADTSYHLPNYPLVFVSSMIKLVPNSLGGLSGQYNIGTDVLSAGAPSGGNALWILLPDGQVKKLFPLASHQNTPGLIDTPVGRLINSSVVEPNMSESGHVVYFSFFHDADQLNSQSALSAKGSDLYRIDLSALLNNYNADPATLPVLRLTTRTYAANGTLSSAERFKDAMNPSLAGSWVNDWGTSYMHPIEMRTAEGLKLIYVSNERRLQNSNNSMQSYRNNNYNLHIADIEPDGSLKNKRQFQYYTTTSALSPNPLREGFAFSYQSTTEDGRHWQAQGLSSSGEWYPVLGYGINPGLIHLGTFCVKNKGANQGDYFVGTRYYNLNNEGFGSLWTQNLAFAGQNTYDGNPGWAVQARQVGSQQITLGVSNDDDPSPFINGSYLGKFTSPRCGRADELFFAYTPTSANARVASQNNRSIYEAYIGFRPNLDPFHPQAAASLQNETGILKVIVDSSRQHNLLWPTPVLTWEQRTGDVQQRVSPPVIGSANSVQAGMPHGEVGTSALWNTDRKPYDCWLGTNGNTPFNPHRAHDNINREKDLLYNNVDGLTYVQNQSNFCEDLSAQNVLGIAIHLTSNKIKTSDINYETNSGNPKETSRLLGVYSVVGQSDQSFKAKIPANVPFDFHLLDRTYGLKLTDVRSWHALQAREKRTNCGGCHEHRPGRAIPFAGTHASQNPPLDMVNQTTYIDYNANCAPEVKTSATATRALPEWKADIWPQFNQYCGSCHNSSTSVQSAALAAFQFSNEQTAFNKLVLGNFASPIYGALGSQAWWYARGHRTDGRNDALSAYNAVPATQNSAAIPAYRFSAVHTNNPGLCDGSNQAGASWVYKFGQWIDNHMPRDTSNGLFNATFDSYHPSVSAGIVDESTCAPASLRVGFWDDSGSLARVEIFVNGVSRAVHSAKANGSELFSISELSSSDSIKVLAEDFAGNRQSYEKSLDTLLIECQTAAGLIPPGNGGGGGTGGGGTGGGGEGGGVSGSSQFTSTPSNPKSGGKVTLALETTETENQSFKLLCSTAGTLANAATGELALKPSKLLKRSKKWGSYSLAAGNGSAKLVIPHVAKIFGKTISCQAKLLSSGVFTEVTTFTPRKSAVTSKAISKINKYKAAAKAKILACDKQWKTNNGRYQAKALVPACSAAKRLSREIEYGAELAS